MCELSRFICPRLRGSGRSILVILFPLANLPRFFAFTRCLGVSFIMNLGKHATQDERTVSPTTESSSDVPNGHSPDESDPKDTPGRAHSVSASGRRRHTKSRTGCVTCKQRRVKVSIRGLIITTRASNRVYCSSACRTTLTETVRRGHSNLW